MFSLSYLFEDLTEEIGNGVKKLVKLIPKNNVGEAVYNITHEPDSGASYGGILLRTKKAIAARQDEGAFNIAKAIPKIKEDSPDRAKQWGDTIKHHHEWRHY